MNPTALGGKATIAINEIWIPSFMLSEITPEFTEGTRTRTTLGGVFNRPSGVFETAQLTFTIFVPNYDYLKHLFPDVYTPATGSGTSGHLKFGDVDCTTREGVPVVVHYECEDNSNNDLYIFSAIAQLNFNPTYNDSDDLSVEVTLMAQPTDDGLFQLGAGLLNKESMWNPVTEQYEAVSS